MKKTTLLFALLVGAFTFAQTPVITAIIDGPCPGGNTKGIEIYAAGIVDFSNYSLEKQSNGNSWGTTTNLSTLGTVTNDFVYVINSSNNGETIFNSEFPGETNYLVPSTSVVSINGDDGIRIVLDSDSSVIDQYGITGEDGTGKDWEHLDSYAKRKNNANPNGGTFSAVNWDVQPINTLDGQGSCNGGSTLATIIGIGSYSNASLSTASINIPGLVVKTENGTISLNKGEVISIHNVLGQEVKNEELSNGIFFITVKEGNLIDTLKIVI